MKTLPDFDTLMSLAQENPQELERIRRDHIEALINSVPAHKQQRLRGLQFQIDAQRDIHANSPMGASLKISEMMHASFAELRTWLNTISGEGNPALDAPIAHNPDAPSAKVMAFPSN